MAREIHERTSRIIVKKTIVNVPARISGTIFEAMTGRFPVEIPKRIELKEA